MYPLSGPVLMTFEESFRIAGQVLGKPIQYRTISMEQYAAMWATLGSAPYFVQHIVEVAKAYNAGAFAISNDDVENITGQKPVTVEEFVKRNKAALLDPTPNKPRYPWTATEQVAVAEHRNRKPTQHHTADKYFQDQAHFPVLIQDAYFL